MSTLCWILIFPIKELSMLFFKLLIFQVLIVPFRLKGYRFILDYIIVDVTMVIENGMKKKLEMITENYRLHVHVTKEIETNYGGKIKMTDRKKRSN